MSEKRFVAEQVDVVNEDETEVWDVVFDTENTYAFMVRDTDTASDLCDLLNEQQATIRKLQDLCGESDSENAKLRIENKKLKAKLREKEEDEKLYANEIVELRKTNEEWLQFKELGGDY